MLSFLCQLYIGVLFLLLWLYFFSHHEIEYLLGYDVGGTSAFL